MVSSAYFILSESLGDSSEIAMWLKLKLRTECPEAIDTSRSPRPSCSQIAKLHDVAVLSALRDYMHVEFTSFVPQFGF